MSVEEIKASYSPEVRQAMSDFETKVKASRDARTPMQQEAETEAHKRLRGMLWAMFPREDTIDRATEDDEESGRTAWRLIDGLRVAGIHVVKAEVA